MKCLAKLLDSILNRLAPLPDLGSDWLADYEAEEESTSPGALYRAAVRRRWETAPVTRSCRATTCCWRPGPSGPPGPAGAKGMGPEFYIEGDTGATGPAGPAGPSGEVDFKSPLVADAGRSARVDWETAPVDVDCPGCDALFPEGWEDQLHDACADCDDEDSAPRPAPAGADENPGRSGLRGTPTDTAPPVSVGTLHPAVVISRTLRAMGVAVPAVAAESAARELHQFFDITPK